VILHSWFLSHPKEGSRRDCRNIVVEITFYHGCAKKVMFIIGGYRSVVENVHSGR